VDKQEENYWVKINLFFNFQINKSNMQKYNHNNIHNFTPCYIYSHLNIFDDLIISISVHWNLKTTLMYTRYYSDIKKPQCFCRRVLFLIFFRCNLGIKMRVYFLFYILFYVVDLISWVLISVTIWQSINFIFCLVPTIAYIFVFAKFQHHQRSGYYISQLIRYSRILESINYYHLVLLDVFVDIRI
jgi:hypothetical protein